MCVGVCVCVHTPIKVGKYGMLVGKLQSEIHYITLFVSYEVTKHLQTHRHTWPRAHKTG